MPFAATVKFKNDSFSRPYHPEDIGLEIDDFVIVHDRELNIERVGFVSFLEGRAPIQMKHLPRIKRLATEQEVEGWYEAKIAEKEMTGAVRERARALNLPIKISDVVYIEDRRQVYVHFASDARVDFRELVKDLSGRFKARIEMWQVGARKEAGLRGGMGICGRELCCSCHLNDFPTISMRHAKDQDIVQPPSKLSGPCGRLRCCLRYEHEAYLALAHGAPKVGCSGCSVSGAQGFVADRNLLKREVRLRSESGSSETVAFEDFTQDDRPRSRTTERPGGRDRSKGPDRERRPDRDRETSRAGEPEAPKEREGEAAKKPDSGPSKGRGGAGNRARRRRGRGPRSGGGGGDSRKTS